MLPDRVLNVQRDLLARFDRISNLWVAYHNSGKYPDDFGREFYHAVGKLLQGQPLDKVELYHISNKIPTIVSNAEVFEKAVAENNNTMTEVQNTKGTACQKQVPKIKTAQRKRGLKIQ